MVYSDIVIIDHISILGEFKKTTKTSTEIIDKFSKMLDDLNQNLKLKSRKSKIEKIFYV
jgi:hypothetical protein